MTMPVATPVMLEREYAFYKANHARLLEQYRGKSLVIVGDKVIGAYDSEIEAYTEARKQFAPETFMVSEIMTDEMERAWSLGFHMKE